MRKPVLPYVDNTAHQCGLISASVVFSLDSLIPIVAISEMPRFLPC